MATSTTNLGLIKPAGTDKIRIAQINSNMDVIDAKMGAVGNTPLQTQITATNNALTAVNNALRPSYQSWQENADSHDFTTTGVFLIGVNPVNFPLPWGVLTVTANRPDTIFQLYEVSGQLYVQEYRGSTWSGWNSVLRANAIAIEAPGNTAPSAITSGQYVFWNRTLYTAKSNIAANAALSTSNLTAVSNGGLNSLKAGLDTLNSNFTPTEFQLTAGTGLTIGWQRCRQTTDLICVLQITATANNNIVSNSAILTGAPNAGGNTRFFTAFTSTGTSILLDLQESKISTRVAIASGTTFRFNFVYNIA